METKFFTGNYSLTIGQPYVIISAEERDKEFFAENIIIFEDFEGHSTVLANHVKYPKIPEKTLSDFIYSEIQVCKDDIFYKILFAKHREKLERRNYHVNIELRETNSHILSFLKDKFPVILNHIKNHTTNGKLSALIELYQSIVVERNDFEINLE